MVPSLITFITFVFTQSSLMIGKFPTFCLLQEAGGICSSEHRNGDGPFRLGGENLEGGPVEDVNSLPLYPPDNHCNTTLGKVNIVIFSGEKEKKGNGRSESLEEDNCFVFLVKETLFVLTTDYKDF